MKLNTPSIDIVAGEEKPARKYTEYNLFFQLEREYILQKLFGVKSALDPDNMFSQEDPKYLGPPLPKRYNDLVLPKEWHIPGKNCKKNRKHTKTHVSPLPIHYLLLGCRVHEVNFIFHIVKFWSYFFCI